MSKAALVDNSLNRIGYVDYSGANNTQIVLDKYLTFPAQWTDITSISEYGPNPNKVLVYDETRQDFGVFDISGADTTASIVDRTIDQFGALTYAGISYLGGNKVVIVGSDSHFRVIDISGTNGSQDKYLRPQSGLSGITDVASLGNNKVVIVDITNDNLLVLDISGAHNTTPTVDKRLSLPTGWGNIVGIGYAGNDKVVVVDGTTNDIGVFDISGTTNATLDKTFTEQTGWTNPSAITTLLIQVPGSPTSVQTNIGVREITVSWGAATAPSDAPVTDYEVRINSGTWISKGVSATSHTFTGLTDDTQYTIEVRAENSAGHGAPASIIARTPDVPNPATNLTVALGMNQMTFGWTLPTDDGGNAITDVEVRINNGNWIPKGASATEHIFTGLVIGTSYKMDVRVENGVGYSPFASITRVLPIPVAIMGVTARINGQTTTLTATFEAAVTGVSASVFSTSAGTLGNFQAVSSTVYTIDLTLPTTGTGTATVTLSANATTPVNLQATHAVSYGPLGVTISGASYGFHSDVITITATLDQAATAAVVLTNFTTSVGVLSNFQMVSSTVYTFDVTLPTMGEGNVTIAIAAGVLTPLNSAASHVVAYRSELPIRAVISSVTVTENSITLMWMNPTGVNVGRSALTDVEVRYIAGTTPGGTWTSIGVVETYTISMLMVGQQYSVEIRFRNMQGLGEASIAASPITVREFSTVPDQIFVVDTAFTLPVTITSPGPKTITDIDVTSIWKGFTHTNSLAGDNRSGTTTISGTPRTIFSGVLKVIVKYSDMTKGELDIEFIVISKTPVYMVQPQIRFFQNTEVNLLLPVTNYNGEGIIRGPLVAIDSEDVETGLLIKAMPDQAIPASDNAMFQVVLPNPLPDGPEIVVNQPFFVDSGTPPAMSVVTGTVGTAQITYSWTAVTGASSYAYQISGMEGWIDVGNVTNFVLSDLIPNTAYTVLWRVNSPFISTTRTVTATPTAPATVPAQITAWTPTAGNARISVVITAPNDGGQPITRYEYSLNNGAAVNAGALTSFVITNLTNGTAYGLRVRAVNSVGVGPWSASVSVTPSLPATLPGIPTSISGVGGNRTATIRWSPPASDGGSAITGYDVAISIGLIPSNPTPTGKSSSARSHTFSNLTNGTLYYLGVRSKNSVGNSGWTWTTVRPIAPTSVPGAAQITSLTLNVPNSSLDFTVSAPSNLGNPPSTQFQYYFVYPNFTNPWSVSVSYGSYFSFIGLAGTYTLYVRAVNSTGFGPVVSRTITLG